MSDRYRCAAKRDVVVLTVCLLLAIANLGAVGGGGRRRAKELVCRSNLRQWGAMFERYTAEHDGRFNRGWDKGETGLWMNALRPYYQDRWNLLLCPSATRAVEGPTGWGTFTAWYRTISLSDGGTHRYVSSYSINSWTNNVSHDRGARPEFWFWKTPDGAGRPEIVPVFGDATWHDAWPRHTDMPLPAPLDSAPAGATGEMNHFCIDRHGGAVDLLFMDWSARKVGLKELWALKWHRSFNTEGPWTRAGGVLPSDWPEWMRPFKDY